MTDAQRGGAGPELWGGVECTVNRVGDRYFDQLERSGHAARLDDLTLFAELGVRRMRYPVLWERTAPLGIDDADWRWPDERLARLRELGIDPIVGLVHHGSGPGATSLLDASFPYGLAAFARAVAKRYPWIERWTPINEPMTTARFSALYGLWYPHATDSLSWARALLVQCRATILAMRAVREVIPGAQLVQTEDMGRTFSTPALAYQAAFENERRWLGFDLLAGRVGRDHRLWRFLRSIGIAASELDWFRGNACPPDVIGINHYLTSERFLDERLEGYPAGTWGGNGRHRYADVEAVRALAEGPVGPKRILREAWERYGMPLAITEVHNGCTREEQMRWVAEVWSAATELRAEGVDVRAVTAWALLGSYDWNTLVTRDDGFYEPGVFDLRAPRPRPTALVPLLRALGRGETPAHPVLAGPGWWRRPDRLTYGPERAPLAQRRGRRLSGESFRPDGPPVLVTGATGTLGRAFGRLCELRGLPYRLLDRAELDIADPASVAAALTEHRPWAVVNTAGYVRVDAAESDVARCERENRLGAATLAAACAPLGLPLATFSTDLVFDGRKAAPYVESDPVAPLSVYGRSKAEAESAVLALHEEALVVRTSVFFGPWDEHNFLVHALQALAEGRRFAAADDVVVTATYVPDLVNAVLDLLIDGERGLWHLATPGPRSWAALACEAAEAAGLDASLVDRRRGAELGWTAPRPAYCALGSERGELLPPLERVLARFAADTAGRWGTASGTRREASAREA
jgi:dTDP-4-dehydrorhamnose reductase